MINVTEEIYRDLAEELMDEIEELNSDFFNGTIELDTEEYYSELKCSLIIFRDEMCEHDGCLNHCNTCTLKADMHNTDGPTKIVPVWWEFELYTQDGPQDNNFSWSEFASYLNPYTIC